MPIPTLTTVDEWPTRRLPQSTFDTSVRTSMNQMSTMVGELNSAVIPGINAVTDNVNTVVANLAAIQAAPTNAANAAASATAAAGSATSAANSATSAAESAAAAAAVTGLPNPTGHDGEVLSVASGAMAWAKRDRAVPLAEGTVTAGACDYATGYVFSTTISGATTISLTNVPATGTAMLMLRLTNGGSAAVTWPSGIKWPGGTAPTLTASGLDEVVLMRTNAGVWSGAVRKDVK